MTVASVVMVPDVSAALEPLDGAAPLRRILGAAWAGGSTPIVLVCGDQDDALRDALARGALGDEGAPSVFVPDPAIPHGVGWFAAGLVEAARRVGDTRAGLLWPFRFPWVDPETVTSLIEAHGRVPDSIIRPAFRGEPGFPALVPLALADRLASMPGRHALDALADLVAGGAPAATIELGDPGSVHDLSTPRDRLPAFEGPPEPAGGPPPDWNEALGVRAADTAVDAERRGSTAAEGSRGEASREAAAALEGGAAPYDQAERAP